jgi:hypothetical protein
VEILRNSGQEARQRPSFSGIFGVSLNTWRKAQ